MEGDLRCAEPQRSRLGGGGRRYEPRICTLCSAERKDGRGSNNFKDCCDVPLCIERTTANGGRSCFGLWHEEKHRATQGARSPEAATAVMADIIAE